MAAERQVTNVSEAEDPSVVLTFKGNDGSDVALTVTVTVDGDVRKVWADLEGAGEREALHIVAGEIFADLTRSV